MVVFNWRCKVDDSHSGIHSVTNLFTLFVDKSLMISQKPDVRLKHAIVTSLKLGNKS